MKYKVGDKVRFMKDCELKDGRIMHAKSVWEVNDTSKEYYLLRGVENGFFAMIGYKLVDDSCEKINTAPSITKRINDKQNILNGLLNSDGSVDGEKLIKKLEENQVQVVNGVVMREKPQRPTGSASTPDDKTKGSHYERASMQPLEVMQRVMTAEQFEGFLYGCCLKYLLRKDYKGERESDEYKARQYAYWLEMVKEGRTINPSKDKVPFDYKFSII